MQSVDIIGTSAALFGAAAVSLGASKSERRNKANLMSVFVCVVAALHYCNMKKGSNLSLLRFSDWLLTCPVLAFEMGFLLGRPLWCSAGAAIASIAMILSGKSAIEDRNALSCILSSVFLAVVAFFLACPVVPRIQKTEIETETKISGKAIWAFFLIWPLYGVAVMMRSSTLVYSVLDTLSKALFALFVALC